MTQFITSICGAFLPRITPPSYIKNEEKAILFYLSILDEISMCVLVVIALTTCSQMQINIGHFLEIQKARVHKSHLHELRKRSSVLWWHVLLCIVMREKNDMQGRRAYIWITKKIWNKSSLRKKKEKMDER